MSRPKEVHRLTAPSLTVAPAGLGTPTLTVGEIAEQLHPIAPNTAATIERIRHWTRERLLLPVDQHHAGTGKHRRYAAESIYDAAILTVVANAGLPIVTQGYLRSALPLARRALRKWTQARSKNQDIPLFLEISQAPNGTGGPTVSIHEGVVKHDPTAELSLTINLSQIFTRVLKDGAPVSAPKRPNRLAKRLP
jgi:hypothetical protein